MSTAQEVAAELTDELAAGKLELVEVLTAATDLLSRRRPGTWIALVMNTDPNTSVAVSGDHEHPWMAASIDEYVTSLARPRVVPTVGLSRSVIETGEPLLLPALTPEELWDRSTPAARAWFERHPGRMAVERVGTLVVPMRARDQLMGTLEHLVWNSPPLTQDDVAWAQLVADRLGVIVEHAVCHNASIERLGRLNAIRNVSLAIASTDDLRLTLELLLEQLTMRLHVDAADILVVDEAAGELYLGAAVGFRTPFPPDLRIPIPKRGTTVAATADDPDWVGAFRRRSLFLRERFQAYRTVPVMAHGALVGMLEIFHRSSFDADQEVLAFLDAMAAQAALAVQNASLRSRAGERPAPRAATDRPDLSAAEWRILGMVVDGATNREIAAAVHLSENTIKFHIRRLLDRLGAVNRTDLARKVTQHSWL